MLKVLQHCAKRRELKDFLHPYLIFLNAASLNVFRVWCMLWDTLQDTLPWMGTAFTSDLLSNIDAASPRL